MKIVTALHLKSWADTITVRADLPGLVADLIRASCPSLEHYRFPSGDASQTHGWDGVADVVEANTFVPEGHSLWEFGAGTDYKAKASKDFDKRTRELTADERSRTSFIFVTPRIGIPALKTGSGSALARDGEMSRSTTQTPWNGGSPTTRQCPFP